MTQHHRIQFPSNREFDLSQDTAYFILQEDDIRRELCFHDYNEIYNRPGLYEQLFYERLKCCSPRKVCDLLNQALAAEWKSMSELRTLDLGAGNGMMAEEMRQHGVSRIVGADIIDDARQAAYRDRPSVYDDYIIADFTKLSEERKKNLSEWHFDCLTVVAALGFGDIPAEAFLQALRFIAVDGWVAFNIKETFLDRTDKAGFSTFVRELIFSEYLQVHSLERYTHRLSMEGVPLKYYALVARLTAPVPADFLTRIGLDPASSKS